MSEKIGLSREIEKKKKQKEKKNKTRHEIQRDDAALCCIKLKIYIYKTALKTWGKLQLVTLWN